jgi:hypothetical protein
VGKAKGNKDIKRDDKGRITPGSGSLNPGGVSRRALEFRRWAQSRLDRAQERLDELLESGDPDDIKFAITEIAARAAGKHAPPSELPDDITPRPGGDASPQSLLNRTCAAYALVLGRFEAKAEVGAPMSESEIASMREMAQTLATLAREERELAKSGPGADLTDEALVAKVLEAVPREKLEMELDARAQRQLIDDEKEGRR